MLRNIHIHKEKPCDGPQQVTNGQLLQLQLATTKHALNFQQFIRIYCHP